MKKIVSYKRMIDQHAEESTNSNRNSFSLWNGRKGKILNSWFVYALCVSSDPHTDNSVLTESADWWKAGCRGKIYLHHLFFTVNLCQSAVARVRIRAYASCKKSLYCDLISFADSSMLVCTAGLYEGCNTFFSMSFSSCLLTEQLILIYKSMSKNQSLGEQAALQSFCDQLCMYNINS